MTDNPLNPTWKRKPSDHVPPTDLHDPYATIRSEHAQWRNAIRLKSIRDTLPRSWAAWQYPTISGLLRGKLPIAPPLHVTELSRPVCPAYAGAEFRRSHNGVEVYRFPCSRQAGHTGRHACYRSTPSDPNRRIIAVWEDQ